MTTTSSTTAGTATRGGDLARQLTVAVSAVLAVIGSFIGSGAAGGTPVQDAAGGALAADATLIAPGSGAFSIWSLIYFGLLAYAGGHQTAGVLLIRFPSHARSTLGEAVARVVAELGERINGAFVVIEPGRARVSRPPAMD